TDIPSRNTPLSAYCDRARPFAFSIPEQKGDAPRERALSSTRLVREHRQSEASPSFRLVRARSFAEFVRSGIPPRPTISFHRSNNLRILCNRCERRIAELFPDRRHFRGRV